jgi:hypothetical protein
MTQTAELTPSDQSYLFGDAVAISGSTIVVGSRTYIPDLATFATAWANGAAYVFNESSTGWANMTQTAKLTASDGGTNYGYGSAVAISGNTIVVGAPFTLTASGSLGNAIQGPGAAYVFVAPSGGWINMTQTAELRASDGAENDYFGGAVAIDGNTVVIGAFAAGNGSNYESGSVYLFTASSAGWANVSEAATLTAPAGAGNSAQFGSSVSIRGDTILVGSPGATVGVNVDQGAAYVYGTAVPPTITSTAKTIANVGFEYSYQVKATSVAGARITFALRTAPAGMSINASSGLLSWSPTASQAGIKMVTVLATDQFGNVAQQSFAINVLGPFAFYSPIGIGSMGPREPNSKPGAFNIFASPSMYWWLYPER